jgi:hypothetical protein
MKNRDVLNRGAAFLEVDSAATHFLAKGAIREEVELTKTAEEEAARLFLCFIGAPAILFGGGQLFYLSVSSLDL